MAPATGKILKINESLKEDPSVMNKSPEADGWIAEMAVEKASDIGKDTTYIYYSQPPWWSGI